VNDDRASVHHGFVAARRYHPTSDRRPAEPGRCQLGHAEQGKGREEWSTVLAEFRRAATPRGRARLGRFAIEGTRAHERALRAAAALESVLLSRGYRDDTTSRRRALLEDLSRAGCRVHVVPDEILASLTGGRSIGAIVGLVRTPEPPSLDRVLGSTKGSRPVLLVAVDVEDPGNVGALTRTALASGATALVAIGISDPFHPRALRISMGSVFKLPILLYRKLDGFLNDLRPFACRTVGAVSTGGTPLPDARFGDRAVAVLMGSEAFGLSPGTTAAVDARITVPMAPGVDSFSVNAAAAVILYEIRRHG